MAPEPTHPQSRPIVLQIAAEVSPFHKSGGLGDVLAGLPPALARAGVDVRIVTGLMGNTTKLDSIGGRTKLGRFGTFDIGLHGQRVPVIVHSAKTHGGLCETYFVEAPHLSRGGLYGHDDDAYRFAILGKSAMAIAAQIAKSSNPNERGYIPGQGELAAIHAHDWHAALAIYYARKHADVLRRVPTLFTIHNLAYQGMIRPSLAPWLDIGWDDFHEAFEDRGTLNLMKGALIYADRITTVSPTYAREIQTTEYGHDLDGLLRWLSPKLRGLTNGIDLNVWNPATDPALPIHFSADNPSSKSGCTSSLRWELGLRAPRNPQDVPILGVVSRLTAQKGLDWLCDIAPGIVHQGGQIVVLGEGDANLEQRLHVLSHTYPGAIAFRRAFDDGLARRIYGASDLFVMPSRFEPCGLAQLYAMRYGAIPVARATGGLVDTIAPLVNQHEVGGATGIVYKGDTADALWKAVEWSMAVFRDRGALLALRRNAMLTQNGWDDAAQGYLAMYRGLGMRTSLPPPASTFEFR